MSLQPEFRHIPLTQLTFSNTTAQKERRAHFAKVGLKELADSIAAVGIAQPILVRAKIEGRGELDQYEVVAGERRVLAAKQVGLTEVPAMVRVINDQQLLELQLIENLQREGLSELAEAEGYEQLMELGHGAEEIAAKVGKSRSYVYGRLKLTELCKEARAAFYDGKLSASTALELAKIPDHGQQKLALKAITEPKWGEPLSVRAAREHIQENYMLRLGSAGFPTDDAALVAKAGACGTCPKRSGNQPELFGDVKGPDLCTDVVCFRGKIAAHGERAIAEAKKTGQKVIAGAAVKKVAPHGIEYSLQEYVKLEDKSWDHDQKTYAQVLGKDYVPTLLQDPDSGKLIKIAPKKDVPKPKRTVGGSGSKASGSSGKKDAAKEKADKQLEKACQRAIFQATLAAAPKKIDRATLQAMVMREIDDIYGPEEELVELMGWDKGKGSIESRIKALSDSDLAQLAAVVLVVEDALSDYGDAHDLVAAAKRYGVDAKKIRDQVKAKAKAAAAPAPAPKVKAKAAAPAKAKKKSSKK